MKCSNCKYFSGNGHLRCAVNPGWAEIAACSEWQQGEERKVNNKALTGTGMFSQPRSGKSVLISAIMARELDRD